LPARTSQAWSINHYLKPKKKYPERSESNCRCYHQIRKLEVSGIDASRIVCSNCDMRKECLYHEECRETKRAQVSLATHERFHRSYSELMKDGLEPTTPALQMGLYQNREKCKNAYIARVYVNF